MRLVKKVDRKNVGVTFNLCHFLKVEGEKNLERRLKEAKPHLFAVNINGADGGNTDQMGWDRLIQTAGPRQLRRQPRAEGPSSSWTTPARSGCSAMPFRATIAKI